MEGNRFEEAAASFETISKEQFNGAVLRGMQRAQRAKRQRFAWAASAATILIVASFIIGLNSSPAFASAVGHVPGLREVAKLVAFDKSLRMALDNDTFQAIGQAETKDGVTLNIGGIMADDGMLTVFWDAHDAKSPKDVFSARVDLRTTDGTSLSQATYSHFPEDSDNGTHTLGIYLVNPGQTNTSLPDNVTLTIDLTDNGPSDAAPVQIGTENTSKPAGSFTFNLTIDKAKKAKAIEYPIHKEITLDAGAKITVDRLVVYPTHARLFYTENPENTKVISYLSFTLTNERGETFTNKSGFIGICSIMESTFFSKSRSLSLVCDIASTLDRDSQEAVIDPVTGKVIGKNSDWLIPLAVTNENSVLKYSYTIAKDRQMAGDGGYIPFQGIITDDKGNSVECLGTTGGSSVTDSGEEAYSFLIRQAPSSGMLHVKIGIPPPFKINMEPIKIK